MRSSALIQALCLTLLGGGALATVEEHRGPNGELLSVTYTPDKRAVDKRDCTHNNCLRAMIARPAQATAFCNTYTTAVSAGVGPFTQCSKGPTQASSACSCFVPVRRKR